MKNCPYLVHMNSDEIRNEIVVARRMEGRGYNHVLVFSEKLVAPLYAKNPAQASKIIREDWPNDTFHTPSIHGWIRCLHDILVNWEVQRALFMHHNNEIRRLRDNHRCDVVPRDPKIMEKLEDDPYASTGAYCKVCDQSHGWFCPESPDKCCHYFSVPLIGSEDIRIVHLRNGQTHTLPKTHEWSNESDDWCIFCEMPEERK